MWMVRDGRALNINTGSLIQIQYNNEYDDFECEIKASGPIGAWWNHEGRTISNDLLLFEGTEKECQNRFAEILKEVSQRAPVIEFDYIVGTAREKPETEVSTWSSNY